MVLKALSLVTKTANAVSSSGAMLLQLQQGVFRVGPRQAVRGMQTALSRNVVLPRLLDTLSATFQQSSTRMDGLINQMTQELEKVGWYISWVFLIHLYAESTARPSTL